MHRPQSVDAQRKKSKNVKRIRVFFNFLIKNDAISPVKIPMTNGKMTIPTMEKGETEALPLVLLTMEMTVKKTITPIMSSIAARGSNVFVTGPLVRYSLTMDKAGAGAVARAIPPKINAR